MFKLFGQVRTALAQLIAETFGLEQPCYWLANAILFIPFRVLFIYLLKLFIKGPTYTKKNRIDGKVVIITGCNTGIGKETALELARRGAKVYMACRDAERCEAARLEIIASTDNQHVYNRSLDLASLKSVRQFAAEFLKEEKRLDILINNAGVYKTPQAQTVDGFETKMGVNHLGHFLLTNLLLERLKQSSHSRIVVVSSLGYLMAHINKEDLNSKHAKYSDMTTYAQSKLANILFTHKLSQMLKDTNVTVNCCHPGAVKTEIFRDASIKNWPLIEYVASLFMKTPQAGAQTTLRLALDPTLENKTGDFYADSIRLPVLPRARDDQMADWLWQESEKLVGLK